MTPTRTQLEVRKDRKISARIRGFSNLINSYANFNKNHAVKIVALLELRMSPYDETYFSTLGTGKFGNI